MAYDQSNPDHELVTRETANDPATWMDGEMPKYQGKAVWTINGRHCDMNRLPRIDEPPLPGEAQAVPDSKDIPRGR